jgi:hypothetical protein
MASGIAWRVSCLGLQGDHDRAARQALRMSVDTVQITEATRALDRSG